VEEKFENEKKDLLKKHALELKKQIAEKQKTKDEVRKMKNIENQQMQ
jgi:hypothetical protein